MFSYSIWEIRSLTSVKLFTGLTEKNVDSKVHKTKKASRDKSGSFRSRGGQIRTDDLLVPNQARYRATLRPEKIILQEQFQKPGGVYPAFLRDYAPKIFLHSA